MKTWEDYQPVVKQIWFSHNMLAVQETKILDLFMLRVTHLCLSRLINSFIYSCVSKDPP